MREETGQYLVQGTETIIENIIGSVDFYVSRAVAGPMGFLETETQGPEEQPGQGRELIPLFQSVYHDIGPVHEDGWIRLIEEEGDLFYWIAARLYVQWGGLMSVHFPITPAERPDGYDGTSEAIGWGGQHQTFDDLQAARPQQVRLPEGARPRAHHVRQPLPRPRTDAARRAVRRRDDRPVVPPGDPGLGARSRTPGRGPSRA